LDLHRERGYEKFVSSQPQYSMLWRVPEREVIPLCTANGISQIVWSPLAQGVLTGKYQPGEPPPPGSRATSARMGRMMGDFQGEATLAAVQRLRPIAERLGVTMAQLALAWVLRVPDVASAIIGASRPDQVHDHAAASGLELPVLTWVGPVLECRDVDAQCVVDLDLDGRVRPFTGCVAWLNGDRCHASAVPA